jgi:protein-S-isoprenylcysteine O-methyltransferase Ste14
MVVRRPPVRVTPKPLYWATAFVATYWGFMTLGFADRGTPIAPMWITHGLALASLVVSFAARVSLGRNIGFVPAQRELVTSYAYGIVRHPIYTGIFLSLTAFVLRAWSPTNFVLAAVPVTLFVIKASWKSASSGGPGVPPLHGPRPLPLASGARVRRRTPP